MKGMFKILIFLIVISISCPGYCKKEAKSVTFDQNNLSSIAKVILVNNTTDKNMGISVAKYYSEKYDVVILSGLMRNVKIRDYMRRFGNWDFNKEFDKIFKEKLKAVNFLPILDDPVKESEAYEAFNYIDRFDLDYTHIYAKTGISTLLIYNTQYAKAEEESIKGTEGMIVVAVTAAMINNLNSTYLWKKRAIKDVMLGINPDKYWEKDGELIKDIFLRLARTVSDILIRDLTGDENYKIEKCVSSVKLYYDEKLFDKYNILQEIEAKKYLPAGSKFTPEFQKQLHEILIVKAYKLQADAVTEIKYFKNEDDAGTYITAIGKAVEIIPQ